MSTETKVRIALLEEKYMENQREHQELKTSILEVRDVVKDVKKELIDLKTNHIIFKTRVLVFWAVGTAVSSALLQLLFIFIGKRL